MQTKKASKIKQPLHPHFFLRNSLQFLAKLVTLDMVDKISRCAGGTFVCALFTIRIILVCLQQHAKRSSFGRLPPRKRCTFLSSPGPFMPTQGYLETNRPHCGYEAPIAWINKRFVFLFYMLQRGYLEALKEAIME